MYFFQAHGDDIRELPEVLADVFQRLRMESTNEKYSNFLPFHKSTVSNYLGSMDILPAKAFPVAVYFASLIQTASSQGLVNAAFYGMNWFHDFNGIGSPTNSKLVVNVLEVAKHILSTQVI